MVRRAVAACGSMKMKNDKQTRLYLASAVILLFGLAGAVTIYLTASNLPDGIADLDADNSRVYLHHLELYGGKANLLAHELKRWFAGLWDGETLAYTVGCITLVLSYGFFHLGYLSYPGTESEAQAAGQGSDAVGQAGGGKKVVTKQQL